MINRQQIKDLLAMLIDFYGDNLSEIDYHVGDAGSTVAVDFEAWTPDERDKKQVEKFLKQYTPPGLEIKNFDIYSSGARILFYGTDDEDLGI